MCGLITAKSWHWTMNCCKTSTIGLLCLVINNSYLCTSGALFNINWLICAIFQRWKGGSADLGCPRLTLAWCPGSALAADTAAGFAEGCLHGPCIVPGLLGPRDPPTCLQKADCTFFSTSLLPSLMAFAKRIFLLSISKGLYYKQSLSHSPFWVKSHIVIKNYQDFPDGSVSNVFNITGTICYTFQTHTLEKYPNNQIATDFTKPFRAIFRLCFIFS